jgi:phosphoglycolate phosphatase
MRMRRRTADGSLAAVLFDWDGTLLDSYHADAQAYLALFKDLGVNWGLEELTRHYSPDWYRVYRAAGIPRARWEEADRLWRSAYGRHAPELMPGARRVLRALEPRFALAIVTSGDRARVAGQLRRFGLTRTFAACIFSEDARQRKPNPAPLEMAMRRLRLAPRRCVYVGDASEDIQMARRAGVRAIAILGPFPTHQRLRAAHPWALLRSIQELPGLLRRAGR